jgi:antitoxin CcdA
MMRMETHSATERSRRAATTRATNLSLSASLVEEAKELGVNISVAAASGLEQAVTKRRAERWIEANAPALDSYNRYVEVNGLPLEKLRLF